MSQTHIEHKNMAVITPLPSTEEEKKNHNKIQSNQEQVVFESSTAAITQGIQAATTTNYSQNGSSTPPPPPSNESGSKMSLAQVATIMSCLCACVFLSALDVTIVTTTLPTMAAHFASASGYTWIATSYTLAYTASTPPWGSVSAIWGRKPVLLVAVAVFFSGSLMCAVVDNFDAFIAGRAVQGLGAAGLSTLVNICISDLFSQRDRGLYYGLTSLVWALASAVGPVMGGAFTDHLSWRWCFWINIPITGVVFILLVFTLKLPTPNTSVIAGLKAIDWLGSALIVGGTLMLLIGLYLGGVYEPWSSATVICLLLFGAVTACLFVLNEWKRAAYPVMPVRLFRAWSSCAAYAVCFFHAFVFTGVAFYLPLYFQAVLVANPLKSGLYMLPMIVSTSIVAALTGAYIQFTGKYLPAVYVGMVLLCLGTGLFIDIDMDTNWAKLISFQLISGIGVGMNFEGPLLAVQAVVDTDDVGAATAVMSFVRTISTAISIVIGGVVFQNVMTGKQDTLLEAVGPELASYFDGGSASAHVDDIRGLAPGPQLIVRRAFFESLQKMWITYLAFSVVGLVLCFFIRGHQLSKDQKTVRLGLREEDNQNN